MTRLNMTEQLTIDAPAVFQPLDQPSRHETGTLATSN